VADNVHQLRERRGLSIRQLAGRLGDLLDKQFHPSGVVKIEKGDRGVDADDLVALALALGVTPNRLLLTGDVADYTVKLTATAEASEVSAWWWATGEQRLPGSFAVSAHQFGVENRPHDPPGTTTLADLRALEASGRLDSLRRGFAEARTAGLGVAEVADLLALWELDEISRQVLSTDEEGGTDGQR
jgi:transcriptional regulator with XRE-family HTH domain